MVQVTVDVDVSHLSDAFSKYPEAKSQGMQYAAQEMVRTLQMNSPVDHGLLKQWFIDSISDEEAHIKTPAAYAEYVNDGTGPYIIEPVNKKALYWEGADHPVAYVVHPGITGQHFIEQSIDEVEGELAGYFLKALEEVMG